MATITKHTQKIKTVFAALIILSLSLYPLLTNFKYNDHSKNWLNHDYGKNLLSSTEENSVFMTEGGDNQVFSSLYFTYAEKLRQDLFPYDQKGNIFKKIYGDLRYVTYQTLEERKPLVDRGLFTGQEPFYADIRSSALPYLVPYALGKPATYLTWKLENPNKLGDFYYKNYGQMYKVQEIRYAILDYLENIKSESEANLRAYTQDTLGRQISNEEWKRWLSQLQSDGYIRKENNSIILVKTYKKPFSKDPKETFIKRWDDIKNLEYYDYLSREIVNSFAFEQVNLLSDEIQALMNQKERNAKNTQEINEQIEQKWKNIEYYISLINKSGYDSIGILHNLGIFYLTAKDKFKLEKDYIFNAISVWENVLDKFIYSWSTYEILLYSYLTASLKDPKNVNSYTEKFDHYYDQMMNAATHWKSMKKDIKKARPYQSTLRLVQIRQNIKNYTGPIFESQKQKALEELKKSANEINQTVVINYLNLLIQKLSLLQDQDFIIQIGNEWEYAWNKLKNNTEFFVWHSQVMYEIINSLGTHIFPNKLVNDTLTHGLTIVNQINPIQKRINTIFILLKISEENNDKYTSTYKNLLKNTAKTYLSPEEYQQLSNQLGL